jgi:hypothetical protein
MLSSCIPCLLDVIFSSCWCHNISFASTIMYVLVFMMSSVHSHSACVRQQYSLSVLSSLSICSHLPSLVSQKSFLSDLPIDSNHIYISFQPYLIYRCHVLAQLKLVLGSLVSLVIKYTLVKMFTLEYVFKNLFF